MRPRPTTSSWTDGSCSANHAVGFIPASSRNSPVEVRLVVVAARRRHGGDPGRPGRPSRRRARSKRSTRPTIFGVRPSSCWNRCARWRRLHPTSLASAATSMAPPVTTQPIPGPHHLCGGRRPVEQRGLQDVVDHGEACGPRGRRAQPIEPLVGTAAEQRVEADHRRAQLAGGQAEEGASAEGRQVHLHASLHLLVGDGDGHRVQAADERVVGDRRMRRIGQDRQVDGWAEGEHHREGARRESLMGAGTEAVQPIARVPTDVRSQWCGRAPHGPVDERLHRREGHASQATSTEPGARTAYAPAR